MNLRSACARAALGALAVMLLSGCYSSNAPLLAPSAAEQPLSAGLFAVHDHGIRIETTADGGYRVSDTADGTPSRLVFNRLPGGKPVRYAFGWSERGLWFYGVAWVVGHELVFDIPKCDRAGPRRIAIAAGASDGGASTFEPRLCDFNSRTQLVGALTRWADKDVIPARAPRLPLGGR